MTEYVGRPSDEAVRAYLDGEYGPPSPAAVQIIQSELEHSARPTCWCGGPIGFREPGDECGLGCLAHIEHDWHV